MTRKPKPKAPEPPAVPVWLPWLESIGIRFEVVKDLTRAREIVAGMAISDAAVAFDLETAATGNGSALDPHSGFPRLAQLYAGDSIVYILDLQAIGGGLEVLRPLADRQLVTFAGVFEAKWLLKEGLEFHRLDDAALAAGLRLDRDKTQRGDLVTLTRHCTNLNPPPTTAKKALQLSDFSGELTGEQFAYAAADPVNTLALWNAVKIEIEEAPKAYAAARGAIVPTARMELYGMPFATTPHAWIASEWAKIKEVEDAAFIKAMEFKPSQRQKFSAWLEDHLPDHARKRWPRTETGRLSGSSKTLAALGLDKALPEVVQYLRANKLASLVSTFGHSLAKLVNPKTNRLHFRLRIAGARSGRYTSSEPNGQNMPGGVFRKVFAAGPGRVILSCDYASVELRVAALLAGEVSLIEVFREPPKLPDNSRNPAGDPHVQVSVALGLPDDPKLRIAKAINYGTLFGMGPRKFALYAEVTEKQALAYLDGWAKLRRKLVEWQHRTNERTYRKKTSETLLGRMVNCHIPAKRSKGKLVSGSWVSHTRGLNIPVQGSAAEAMLVAIAKVDAGLVELRQAGGDAFLCVTVHDELVVDSAVEDADQAAAILESGMREGFREVFGELPDYEAIARYVVGGVECAPSWGGETFDPETMTEQDRKNLFKGLGESIDEIKPDDEDDDENAIEIAIIQEFETVEAKGEDGP